MIPAHSKAPTAQPAGIPTPIPKPAAAATPHEQQLSPSHQPASFNSSHKRNADQISTKAPTADRDATMPTAAAAAAHAPPETTAIVASQSDSMTDVNGEHSNPDQEAEWHTPPWNSKEASGLDSSDHASTNSSKRARHNGTAPAAAKLNVLPSPIANSKPSLPHASPA